MLLMFFKPKPQPQQITTPEQFIYDQPTSTNNMQASLPFK
jgi:hypothetical protein